MLRSLRAGFAVLVVLAFSTSALARVTRVEVLSRTPLAADSSLGIPAYEKITARVYFAVNPANEHNRRIMDLNKAPRNAKGEVEFSADLYLLRPMSRSNEAMLLEIPNRGGKGMLSIVDGSKGDPASAADFGDGWLLKQGYTYAALGWQWDAPSGLRLYAPVAYDAGGKRITGLLRDDFTPFKAENEVPLGHIMGWRLGGTEYPVATPDDPRNVLTVRDTPHGQRTVIPRSEWSFAHTVDGKLTPSDRFLRLNTGFVPGKIYELVYVAQDPVVAGLGLAAVRDFASWVKHSPDAHSPDALAPVHSVYASGISQSGRFLRDLLYEGFNADENGKIALDGVLAHVAGGGRGDFNYRFAQPSRDAQPMASIDWPTDIFPFTDLPESNPAHPGDGKSGILDAAVREHVVPKIFFSHTSYEYWSRAASLIHTTADGKADVPISPNVRIYFFSGLQHFSVPFPPKMEDGDLLSQNLPSPLPIRWFWRAMIANMDRWVRDDRKPPASRYPKIADGTLVPVDQLTFPAIPGIKLPPDNAQGWEFDFGPGWRAGILSEQPPKVLYDYRALVPQVDADGNDLGGIALPEITVSLATYTGWNLRSPAIGAPTQRISFLGSFSPFPLKSGEPSKALDPRVPIAKRYESYTDYRVKFEQALGALVKERYILPEDAPQLLDRSKEEWDWITSPAHKQ
ncbi:alpha/beta hydrolase domain-containing protein [Acidicapsa dinghuensis]|uniref:Alpha/beta hydrolase domain-containing protein n=1 Tax=Acidicapsa dinghuensis TaxID=2218256 RepID=A0ABW1EB25_9BACT|nr:alpha/beta hydrolase domain-containing protein [Acidicapsa dinghuensis]